MAPVVDHVGIVVWDVDDALERFAAILGGRPERYADDEALDCRWGRVLLPSSVPIELVAPRSPRSPYHGFLERRGEGLHHVSFRVDDLVQERERIEALGVRVTGVDLDHSGWQELFVHPHDANSTLLHFAVPPPEFA